MGAHFWAPKKPIPMVWWMLKTTPERFFTGYQHYGSESPSSSPEPSFRQKTQILTVFRTCLRIANCGRVRTSIARGKGSKKTRPSRRSSPWEIFSSYFPHFSPRDLLRGFKVKGFKVKRKSPLRLHGGKGPNRQTQHSVGVRFKRRFAFVIPEEN